MSELTTIELGHQIQGTLREAGHELEQKAEQALHIEQTEATIWSELAVMLHNMADDLESRMAPHCPDCAGREPKERNRQ